MCRQGTGDVNVTSASAFSLPLASYLVNNRDRIAESYNRRPQI